jgi:NitT/TauT family transport system permease protein
MQNPLGYRNVTWLGAVSIAVLILLYTAVSRHQHEVNPKDETIPSWTQLAGGVAQAVGVNERAHERWVVTDMCASSGRLFMGLAAGIAISIALGLLMGCSFYVEAGLTPPLSLLAKIPPTAALAVFFVLVGTQTEMYVAIIAFGIVPSLSQVVYLAVREVPDELIYKARTLGASRAEIICDVLVPHALPKILDAVRRGNDRQRRRLRLPHPAAVAPVEHERRLPVPGAAGCIRISRRLLVALAAQALLSLVWRGVRPR